VVTEDVFGNPADTCAAVKDPRGGGARRKVMRGREIGEEET
jgi:hypothetical protein